MGAYNARYDNIIRSLIHQNITASIINRKIPAERHGRQGVAYIESLVSYGVDRPKE